MNQRIRELIKGKTKEKHPVAELLQNVRKMQDEAELGDAIPLRMGEISSMIAVIKAVCACGDHDESFYQEEIGRLMYLFERRFEDLEIMTEALIYENADLKKARKAA
jgi:hypothetical protein